MARAISRTCHAGRRHQLRAHTRPAARRAGDHGLPGAVSTREHECTGDLVTAGPMLVTAGRSLVDGEDREGFSAGASQFDSDITADRHPRCALRLSRTELFAVACDGRRTGVDAGLDLPELARLMITFGCENAINLDGGGSATLVHRGHLLNRPYSSVDQPAPESRPVVTAILFEPARR
ncbi:MAG TPA: phosphodiester glycosidase family protein [Solirubrobacterales bacterium]|nr:phosphodiester glycosidase family protein [Solirubrobacterales bacterium]